MNNPQGLEIKIKVNGAPDDNPSPTFGGAQPKIVSHQGMEKVGKHGKSHHEYMKVQNQHKPVK